MTERRRNGTLRNIGIVVGILMALASVGGIIWTFGKHSGGLDRVEKKVIVVKEDVKETKGRVRKVEDAVILIQSDISYIQKDVAKILTEVEK